MDRRTKAALNRDKAVRLNEAWGVGAAQVRYSDDGHWYATLARFPAALFDAHGYIRFATEEEYRTSPHISAGKQISVPKPGISDDVVAARARFVRALGQVFWVRSRWFVFRVYRELVGGKPDAGIKGPDAPVIGDIARQLAQEEAVLKSIRRYQGRDLVWFGEWTSPDGTLHHGGSNQTIAYKHASSLLREKAGSEVRAAPITQTRTGVERPLRLERPVEKSKGCLSVIVIGAISLLAVFGTSVWLAKAVAQHHAPADTPRAARR